FDDERIERQLRREPPDLQRALERYVAAEAEMHAVIDERLCLLETAVERVRDAAMNVVTPQPFQHLILRFPHMADHGQIEFARELELLVVIELLRLVVEPFHEIIEPDFAQTDKARIVETCLDLHAQHVEIGGLRLRREKRMNAERI